MKILGGGGTLTSRSNGRLLLCECECEWDGVCPFVCAAAYAGGVRARDGGPDAAVGTSCVVVVVAGDSSSWACVGGVGVVVCGAGCSWGGGLAASAESRSMLAVDHS